MEPTRLDPEWQARMAAERRDRIAPFARYVEPALTVATGLASEPVAGWAGIVSGDPENVANVHHALTYVPRTESGAEGLHGLGEFLGDVGAGIMRTPYVGDSVRYFNESADALGAISPAAGAALQTFPVMAALGIAPEVRGAFKAVGGEIGDTIASGGNIGKGSMMAGQRGAVRPDVLMQPLKQAAKQGFKLSRATTGVTALERGAERTGKALERTHKAYVSEKLSSEHDNGTKGRNLFAH